MLQYARSEETGKLTPLEPASLVGGAGGFIASMAFNVTGTTLYSSSEGGINQFSRDVRTGPLRVWPFTLVSNSPAPHGFACSPDGANVYVANWETNAVDIYSLD
jgi:DNA-binding beta-propeller fold protein YncE